ncbi:esterase-like activity of phytase family protein [Mucilaginibacter achroorhodeus]|uniref:Esterase-like activity of phytase family protein n=1 Tax=Mucilaginibacter achroorhodeus TaxID=2599294 RepID=A0A563UA19_9SPHI|nr:MULTISPECIES: esterase-like activity of phytase family protein [Mucilaginibacter]QXV66694.1 esterase-like activity of phytase family protein [Mucilaginibacter sp. 21P]TWR28195.1 esterase-like activity of phytase family protein [Mucilaginibacter achroorhodeus]
MNKNLLTILAVAALSFSACKKDRVAIDPVTTVSYPDMAEASDPAVLFTTAAGVKVYNGGFGSALAADPNDPTVFYLMTDRGPNVAGTAANSIILGKADFTPAIGKFRLKDGKLVLEQTIAFKNAAGANLNGLPNPTGQGATGEVPYDLNGNVLQTSADGIDSEGLVRAADGSFWVSDEYGPHIVHFDATGKTIERINPFGTGTGGRKIPLVFAKRRANRGMEGLAITPDGKTLVGLMQSPMYNPSKAAIGNSVVLRILTYEIATGKTKQYAYLMDDPSLTGCSEITAVNATTFLTIERDGLYGGAATNPAKFKKIFKIDISNATDISDPDNGANGKLYGGKTVEELGTTAGLQGAGITPVTKTLVLDLLKDLPTVYPHDKAEGITLLPGNILAISNDDDFGVVDNGSNTFAQKLLPLTGKVDHNSIYFVKIKL